MYKIINQLTKQEETFEHRDELFSKLEIINERMKSNKINGIYLLYSLNSEGEILQEERLEIPFVGIIDQLLENFGMSVGKKKKGFLHFLAKHKEKKSSQGIPEPQPQLEYQPEPEPDPELEDLTVKKEANMARQRIAELVSQKPQDQVGKEVPLEDKINYSSSEWTTDHFSRLDENEEEQVEPSQDENTQDAATEEVSPVVETFTQKEDKMIPDQKVESSFSLSHATTVNLPSEVIDSFEAQTITYKQSIKNKIKSNEGFIKEANEEIAQCQNRIDELQQQILTKESQATQLKDLYFKIEEVS